MKFENSFQQQKTMDNIIGTFIKLHNLEKINKELLYCIYGFGILQPIIFSQNPRIQNGQIYLFQSQISNNIITPLDYLWYCYVFARPDLIFDSLEGIKSFGYFIPLFCILMFEILPIMMKNFEHKIQIKKIDSFYKISSIYSQLMPIYLNLPFNILCFRSIKFNTDNLQFDGIHYFNIIISSIILVWLFVTNFLKLLICKETINFNLDCFHTLKITIIDFTLWLLNIFQSFGIIFLEQQYQINLQSIFILIESFLICFNIFNYTTCKKNVVKVTFAITSFGILQSILFLIFSSNLIDKQIIIFIILLLPFLMSILWKSFNIYDKQISNIQNNNLNIISIENIKYIFAKFFNDQFTNYLEKIIIYTNILQIYKSKKTIYIFFEPWINEKGEFLPDNLKKFFYQFLLKKYIFQLQKFKSYNKDSTQYIHYVCILYRLGLNNLAAKQITILLNQVNIRSQSDSKSISKVNLSQVDQVQNNKAFQTRSSRSIEIQDAAIHQINKTNKLLASVGSSLLPIYQIIRLKVIREYVRNQLKSQFYQKQIAKENIQLSKGINLFIQSEYMSQYLKQKILKLIKKKLQLFISLQSVKHIQSNILCKILKRICQNIQKLENKLENLYKQFPSIKIQSLLCYFQAELVNNYLKAQKIISNSSIDEDKLFNLHNIEIQSLFNKDIIFLNLLLLENTQELQIKNMTNQAKKYFKRNINDFTEEETIHQLLPEGIRNEHSLLVQRFLQHQQSKFYLSKNINFFSIKPYIIEICHFFFEINLSNFDQINFFSFFSSFQYTSAYIMVDVNNNLGGISQNLFDKIGFINYKMDNLQTQLLQVPIKYLIQDFDQLVDSQSHPQNQIMNMKFKFLKQAIIFSENNREFTINIPQKQRSIIEWHYQESLTNFYITCKIQQNDLFGFYYYILEIIEVKSEFATQTQSNTNYTLSSKSNNFPIISDQEATLQIPKSLEIQQDKINLNLRNNQLNDEQDQSFQLKNQLLSISILEDKNNDQSNNITPHIEYDNSNIISPIAQNNNQQQQLQIIQQNLLNIQNQKSQQSNDSSKNDNNSCNQNQIRINQIKLEQIYKSQGETDSSQFGGLKTSHFYKKYELFQEAIKPNFPKVLKILLLSLIIQFLIAMIYCILIITNNNQDLIQFTKEIDMIELHSSFMAPHDLLSTMRIALATYSIYASSGVINTTELEELTDPFYNNIFLGYEETKNIFISQLQNENLQRFFDDRTINIIFMSNSTTTVYSKQLNIREALKTLIYNLYQTSLMYYSRLSVTGTAVQVFTIANPQILHNWLEEVTLEILVYSKDRSKTIQQQWTDIFIVFIFATFLPIVFSLFYYRNYYQKQDKYLNMFKFCSGLTLETEIERYKYLVKDLEKNTEDIFLYRFDVRQKEQMMLKQHKLQEVQLRKVKQERQFQAEYEQLSILLGITIIFFVWGIYLGIGMIIFQADISYLNKYSSTVDIYKLIQDMTYSSATLYMNRDFHLIINRFPYLTTQDEETIMNLIDQGLQNIDKFNILCNFYDADQYQVSTDFTQFLNSITSQSVCEILGDEILGFVAPFCLSSIQGNFVKGILPVLNYVKNNIQTQILANNFTKRIEFPLYDNEAGIIMTRVFQLMTQKLKGSMLVVANNLQDMSTILAASYISFSIIASIFILHNLKNYLFDEFIIIKQFIKLLPIQIILLDDQFERYLRILLIGERQ